MTTAAAATDYIPVLRRPHTILGVCEAIGEDFGFNPLILRVLFAAGLFYNAVLVIGLYFAVGGIVALSRWIAPVPMADPAPEAPVHGSNDQQAYQLAA